MIRFIFFILLLTPLFAQEENDIDQKIHKVSKKLTQFSQTYSNLNNKMAKTAKAIIQQKILLQEQREKLSILKQLLKLKEKSFLKHNKELQKLSQQQQKLQKAQNKLEEQLVFLIAKSVTLSMILDQKHSADETSLIESQVLKTMLKQSKQKINNLSDEFSLNNQKITSLYKRVTNIQKSISTIESKKKQLLKIKQDIQQNLRQLKQKKQTYKKALEDLLHQQDSIKKTLAGLHIIKIDKLKKERERKAREAAYKRERLSNNANLPKVKHLGSSYQAIKTIRYRGPKTIAPLKNYTITKRYGTYTDPIYGIKIFNESISLKPKYPQARVRTVFDGKVIYADKTAVLNNMVIIEHRHGLHTIYANLSQIAPTIKKGFKIRKGYTIGRVKDELIFEVTQKSHHINPTRLFQ
ncbi:Membrane-bound metallopeptidase [hydrothermal vent metagenome]|uniref:Membrane-bound metallopeptidase n=1 Tax=hydrothermal vent metagenome TaxID=652676 RepID=A0A1W1D2F3_9ZZZZ